MAMDNATLKVNIIRARRNNPCATLEEIGTRYGVTRERTRQVLSEAGQPTGSYRQTYLCIQCGKNIGTRKGLFCSRQCQYGYGHIKIACTYCGKLREYRIKWLIWKIKHDRRGSELFFCSKLCQGLWLAEEHGFVAHPENIRFGGGKQKWDYSKVYELRDKMGWGALRISRVLQIPVSTVSVILKKGIINQGG